MSGQPDASAAGTISVGGDLTVNRMGFGAMRITGDGIWGEPPSRDRAVAAHLLGIGRTTLYRKLKEYKLTA